MDNLGPFWALVRRAGPNASHNMKLDTEVLRDPGFDAKACQSFTFTVRMPVARNVSHISKGDVLCLPFSDEFT